MRSQCGAIFQIGQIIYVDDGNRMPAAAALS
jgi:hypothetical protein